MELVDCAKHAPKDLDFDIQCACACADLRKGADATQDMADHPLWAKQSRPPLRTCEQGLLSYSADINLPLSGPVLHTGPVRHLLPDEQKTFIRARLTLYSNGIHIQPEEAWRPSSSIAWSPFSLVQACRLHSVQADCALPWLRLFKVSVFQHGATHFFAVEGDDADFARARWVADIARSLRQLTQSLYPTFILRVEPLPGAGWTSTRLLAGYLLLCDDKGVSLVYAELHAHWGCSATFAAYEDEFCDTQVVRLSIDMHTCVSERVGIDCSCFSFDGYHFTTRTCAEKVLWLRAISNVKVKLRHRAPNPTPTELRHYRESIIEYVGHVKLCDDSVSRRPLLPRRSRRNDGPDSPPKNETESPESAAQPRAGSREEPARTPCSPPHAEVSVPMTIRPMEPPVEDPEDVPIGSMSAPAAGQAPSADSGRGDGGCNGELAASHSGEIGIDDDAGGGASVMSKDPLLVIGAGFTGASAAGGPVWEDGSLDKQNGHCHGKIDGSRGHMNGISVERKSEGTALLSGGGDPAAGGGTGGIGVVMKCVQAMGEGGARMPTMPLAAAAKAEFNLRLPLMLQAERTELPPPPLDSDRDFDMPGEEASLDVEEPPSKAGLSKAAKGVTAPGLRQGSRDADRGLAAPVAVLTGGSSVRCTQPPVQSAASCNCGCRAAEDGAEEASIRPPSATGLLEQGGVGSNGGSIIATAAAAASTAVPRETRAAPPGGPLTGAANGYPGLISGCPKRRQQGI